MIKSLYKEGYGVEDILFLLIFSLDENLFKNNLDNILQYYFDIINNVIRYSYEDFTNHYMDLYYTQLLDYV